MAIDTALSPTRSARSVTSGVVGMASFTAPSPVGDGSPVTSEHQVVTGEQMPVLATVPSSHCVYPMGNLVEGVLGVSPIFDVGGDVVGLVPVDMTSNQTFRTQSMESQSYEVVDLEASLPTIISVESDVRVPLVIGLSLQDPTLGSRSRNRQDMAAYYCPVITEPRNVRISAIHADDYTEGAVA